jgi:hypothetical protein
LNLPKTCFFVVFISERKIIRAIVVKLRLALLSGLSLPFYAVQIRNQYQDLFGKLYLPTTIDLKLEVV